MESPPSTIEIDKEMLSVLTKGSRVLEIACAHGRTAFNLEEMGFNVTAVDIDPEAIDEASRSGKNRGSRVKFIIADGRKLPLGNDSFDACIMNGFLTMLIDFDSRLKVMNEAFRVLVERGTLYVADFIQTWNSPAYRERYESHEKITGERGTFIVTDSGTTGGVELYRAHHHTEEELRSMISSRFRITREVSEEFTSFHGNRVNGMKIIAQKE